MARSWGKGDDFASNGIIADFFFFLSTAKVRQCESLFIEVMAYCYSVCFSFSFARWCCSAPANRACDSQITCAPSLPPSKVVCVCMCFGCWCVCALMGAQAFVYGYLKCVSATQLPIQHDTFHFCFALLSIISFR